MNLLFPEYRSYRTEFGSNWYKLPVILLSNAKKHSLSYSSVPYLGAVLPSDDLRLCAA